MMFLWLCWYQESPFGSWSNCQTWLLISSITLLGPTPHGFHHRVQISYFLRESKHDATGLSDRCSKLWLCEMTVLCGIIVIRGADQWRLNRAGLSILAQCLVWVAMLMTCQMSWKDNLSVKNVPLYWPWTIIDTVSEELQGPRKDTVIIKVVTGS